MCLHLLIQTLFCWVRVVVQNMFIVTSVSPAVILILKFRHLVSKVARHSERIERVKEWSVDRKLDCYQQVSAKTVSACPWRQRNLQRIIFKKLLVPLIPWINTSHPRQNNNTLRGKQGRNMLVWRCNNLHATTNIATSDLWLFLFLFPASTLSFDRRILKEEQVWWA